MLKRDHTEILKENQSAISQAQNKVSSTERTNRRMDFKNRDKGCDNNYLYIYIYLVLIMINILKSLYVKIFICKDFKICICKDFKSLIYI